MKKLFKKLFCTHQYKYSSSERITRHEADFSGDGYNTWTDVWDVYVCEKCGKTKKNIKMTQQEKDLLLVDLCARLPYGVMIQEYCEEHGYYDAEMNCIGISYFSTHEASIEGFWMNHIENVRLYLRPMSSMTEEERKEYKHLVAFSGSSYGAANLVDWLNKKMFAYRTIDGKDMFELGLALEALKGMYEEGE